ncbi:MAG: hypothetical protein ABGX27_03020 [Desulfurobacteriaceae bacterium]
MRKVLWLVTSLTFLLQTSLAFGENSTELLTQAVQLFKAGKYKEALKVYESILREGIASPKIYNNVGVIYTKLYEGTGKDKYIKRAIAFFTLAYSLDKSYKIADENLNNVISKFLNERLEKRMKKSKEELQRLLIQKQKEESTYQTIKTREILKFLEEWKSLWEKEDPKYFNLYSPEGCIDYEKFVEYKKRVWKRSKNVKVRIENIHIRKNKDNTVCVTFRQFYSSSIMKSVARKVLCLKKENGKIKIYCEWFIPTVRIE